jgi:hypothetical protein
MTDNVNSFIFHTGIFLQKNVFVKYRGNVRGKLPETASTGVRRLKTGGNLAKMAVYEQHKY